MPTIAPAPVRESIAAQITPHLSAMRHARDAHSLLDGPHPVGPGSVHLLPCFTWQRPRDGVLGRKDTRGTLHPVAITWDEGTAIVVPPGQTRTCSWSATGLGIELSGRTYLGGAAITTDRLEEDEVPHTSLSRELGADQVRRELDLVSQAGRPAMFAALAVLEPFVRDQVHQASLAVGRDVTGSETGGHATDSLERETVVTHIVYGRENSNGRLWRAVERCIDPRTTQSVDLVRYLASQIRRDAKDGVRSAIGDPSIGPRIRRLARSMGFIPSLDVLIDEYNRLYPGDRLSTSRAVGALTAAPSLDVAASRWDFLRGSEADDA